jgi:hypothetical protein
MSANKYRVKGSDPNTPGPKNGQKQNVTKGERTKRRFDDFYGNDAQAM